jgi:predicted nucleotidyltransferase
MLSVSIIKKYGCASVIRAGENGDMEDYRQLLNDVTGVYIAKNICC